MQQHHQRIQLHPLLLLIVVLFSSPAPHGAVSRYVDPLGPLSRYDWRESYCRLLQQHVAGGLFGHERFQGCVALAGGRLGMATQSHFLVVAPQHANETREAEV